MIGHSNTPRGYTFRVTNDAGEIRRSNSPLALGAGGVTALAVLLGGFAVFWATNWGSGRAGDSHAYVASARNVLAGNWVTFEDYDIAADPKPLEQFPPGYPLMLAAGGLLGMDPVPFSRWLNMATLAVTVGLAGWLILVHTRSLLATAIGVLTLALSPVFLFAHSNLLSDAVFTGCCAALLAGLVAAERCIDRPGVRTALLCLAALAAGWSCTIRYAGIFLIFVGVASVLLWPSPRDARFRLTPSRRLTGAVTFAFVAALLPAAVAIFNLWVLGRPTSRPLAVHPPSAGKFGQLFQTIGEWLIPAVSNLVPQGAVQGIGAAALVALTLAPLVWLLFRLAPRAGRDADAPEAEDATQARPSAWAVTVFLFAAGYTPFIITAHTFQDAGIPFNKRMFLPLWFAGWVFATGTLGRWAAGGGEGRPRRILAAAVLVLGVLVLGGSAVRAFTQARVRHEIGWGHEGPQWTQDKILQTIRSNHWSVAGHPLASNGGDLIGLTTDRRSAHVPKWFSRPRGKSTNKMPARIRQFGRWAMAEDARIIYFYGLNDRYDFLSDEKRLLEQLHLKVLVEKREGRIYKVAAIRGFEDEDYDSDGRPDWENLEGNDQSPSASMTRE